MRKKQRRWGYRAAFAFNDDTFAFEFEEPTGGRAFESRYEMLAFDRCHQLVRKPRGWLRIVYISCLCMVVATAVTGSLILILCCLLLGVATAGILLIDEKTGWLKVSITRIACNEPPDGVVCVIKDREHDLILDELKSRRLNRLGAILGKLDLEGDLVKERAKFDWLLDEGAIDANRHAEVIKQIDSCARLSGESSASIN